METKRDLLDQADVIRKLRELPSPLGDEHAALESMKAALKPVEEKLREIARTMADDTKRRENPFQSRMWE